MKRSSSQWHSACWRRSSYCTLSSCIEVAQDADGLIALRDSKNLEQPPIVLTRDEMRAWVLGAKAGEFDEFC